MKLRYFPTLSDTYHDLRRRKLRFWCNEDVSQPYKYLLINVLQMDKLGLKTKKSFDAEDAFVLSDSGGYQLALGKISPDTAKRKWISKYLPLMTKIADAGFILDWPPKQIVPGDNNYASGLEEVQITDFREVVKRAMYTIERWKESMKWLERYGESNFKLIPVLHGSTPETIRLWLELHLDEGVESDVWAIAFANRKYPGVIKHVIMPLTILLPTVRPRIIHLLGVAGSGVLLAIAYLELKYRFFSSYGVEELWFDSMEPFTGKTVGNYLMTFLPQRHDIRITFDKDGYRIYDIKVLPCTCEICERIKNLVEAHEKYGSSYVRTHLSIHNLFVMVRDIKVLEHIINHGTLKTLEFWVDAMGAKKMYSRVVSLVEESMKQFLPKYTNGDTEDGILRWLK